MPPPGRLPAIVVAATPAARSARPAAAALALAVAERREREAGGGAAPLLVDLDRLAEHRPSVLASATARDLAAAVGEVDGWRTVPRGRICVAWPEPALPAEPPGVPPQARHPGEELERLLADPASAGAPLVVHAPPPAFRPALAGAARAGEGAAALVQSAPDPEERLLLGALSVELRRERVRHKIWRRGPGAIPGRRALAGLDPGGETARRARGAVRALADDRGQAVPALAGLLVAVMVVALALVALGGGVTAKARAQRAVDLAAMSAARSMRDDFHRLFIPAVRADGTPDPRHLPRAEYEARATEAARVAGERNGLSSRALEVSFPGSDPIAPTRVQVEAEPEIEIAGEPTGERTELAATAELSPPATATAASTAGGTVMASGGGYSGPLAIRQGKPMRPDVAAAFDEMAAAAAADGVALVINSGFRSDAEQAELFAANPDPRMVAPPGQSLHRCGTELDIGPSSAYGWLAGNAGRFGFLQRYSWEPWHYGYTEGPEPCSAEGDRVGAAPASGGRDESGGGGDGKGSAGPGLPGFVPPEYRGTLLAAASRHDVSAALLAAQIMAESGFNPAAVSPAGAQGIAQFMPATAAAYGLSDPFDPEAAIDAQARLMSELLAEFGEVRLALAAYNAGPGAVSGCMCIPPYPETQAYVAKIMAMLDGAGELGGAPEPELEVRIVA